MESRQFEQLAILRAVVGYLGERDQNGWWQTSFFASGSQSFLTPLFPRTRFLARCNGVSAAATRAHDERIGIGRVHHLFRLPEDVEQHIHRLLQTQEPAAHAESIVGSPDSALNYLQGMANVVPGPTVGPVRVGAADDLRATQSWSIVAGYYAQAFVQGRQVYPYFTDSPP